MPNVRGATGTHAGNAHRSGGMKLVVVRTTNGTYPNDVVLVQAKFDGTYAS